MKHVFACALIAGIALPSAHAIIIHELPDSAHSVAEVVLHPEWQDLDAFDSTEGGCSTSGAPSSGFAALLLLALGLTARRRGWRPLTRGGGPPLTALSASILLVAVIALPACLSVPDNANAIPGNPDDPAPAFDGCEGDSQAHDVFNAFWTTFDDHYAVFDVRLTDTTWAAVGVDGCEQVSPGMDDSVLFDVLLEMAENLDDGHVTIIADDLRRDEDAEVSIYPLYDQVYALEDLVENEYLDGTYERAAEDELSWGAIGNIGYISITSMDDLSASGDEDDDVAAASAAMQAAMGDLSDLDGIIVDVRANEGGWDSVSLEVAAWFAGPRQLAWSEQIRNGPGHTDFAAPTETFVDATRVGGFEGPVVVLTSGGTYSAAETFVLAMRVRPNVTVVGETTSGHLSDMIDGTLPNGWEITFSGERYIAADGQLYEAVGIPADSSIELDVSAMSRGVDNMLEAALAQLP